MLFHNAIRNKTKTKAHKKTSTFRYAEEVKLNWFKSTRDQNDPHFLGSLLANKDEEIA